MGFGSDERSNVVLGSVARVNGTPNQSTIHYLSCRTCNCARPYVETYNYLEGKRMVGQVVMQRVEGPLGWRCATCRLPCGAYLGQANFDNR